MYPSGEKQPVCRGNVGRIRCGQKVVARSNQVLDLVTDKLAESSLKPERNLRSRSTTAVIGGCNVQSVKRILSQQFQPILEHSSDHKRSTRGDIGFVMGS